MMARVDSLGDFRLEVARECGVEVLPVVMLCIEGADGLEGQALDPEAVLQGLRALKGERFARCRP